MTNPDRMRVDAPAKATGTAPYAYEQPVEEPLHLFPLVSTIARGRITAIDDAEAHALPGVRLVLTHANAPRIRVRTDAPLTLLQSTEVHHRGELVGAVVADSPQVAREAAGLVRISYDEQPAELGFAIDDPRATVPRRVNAFKHGTHERGDADAGLERGTMVEADYSLPMEFHAPIEPNAVTAIWHDVSALHPRTTRLTMYDTNQGPGGLGALLAPVLGLLPGQIEVDLALRRWLVRLQGLAAPAPRAGRDGRQAAAGPTREVCDDPSADVPHRRPPPGEQAADPPLGRGRRASRRRRPPELGADLAPQDPTSTRPSRRPG